MIMLSLPPYDPEKDLIVIFRKYQYGHIVLQKLKEQNPNLDNVITVFFNVDTFYREVDNDIIDIDMWKFTCDTFNIKKRVSNLTYDDLYFENGDNVIRDIHRMDVKDLINYGKEKKIVTKPVDVIITNDKFFFEKLEIGKKLIDEPDLDLEYEINISYPAIKEKIESSNLNAHAFYFTRKRFQCKFLHTIENALSTNYCYLPFKDFLPSEILKLYTDLIT